MNELDRFEIIFGLLSAGFAAKSIAGVTFAQNYQPTQQGAATGPGVYVHQLVDVMRGHVRRDSVWNVSLGKIVDVELQTHEVSYQVTTLATLDPANLSALTAGDLARIARQIMQSSATIDTLRASGLAVLRVADIRNPPLVNDEERNQFAPSFDFTLTYDEIYTADGLVVESVEYNINRV